MGYLIKSDVINIIREDMEVLLMCYDNEETKDVVKHCYESVAREIDRLPQYRLDNVVRVYECKKEFELSKWDTDNDCFSDEIMTVEKGSMWQCTGSGYICGGEIRLESFDTSEWIEMSKETFKEYFSNAEIEQGVVNGMSNM